MCVCVCVCVCVEGCSIKQVNIQQGHHPEDEFLKFSLEKRQKLVKMRYEYLNKNEKKYCCGCVEGEKRK